MIDPRSIVIAPPPAVPPLSEEDEQTADTGGWYDDLAELNRKCKADGLKGHDRAFVLIHACIGWGINTRARIRGALKTIGFDPAHVVIILNAAAGSDPERSQWRCTDGIYESIA